jgi:hypothetical protein
LPVLILAYLLVNRREVALYQEGAFCDELTIEQIELLCRRPALFTLERFDVSGLRAELFNRYISSVVGQVRSDATPLDLVRSLMRFIANLPDYSLHCAGLSPEAERVRAAFQQAHSRCRPWRAKRRPVVPGRRRRERTAGVAKRPAVPKPQRWYAERIRHAVKPGPD